MAAHLQGDDRHGQRKADPEAPGHVDKLGVGPGLGRDHHGFKRHAADRAGARTDLPDLRVHRAGVDRAFRKGLGLRRLGSQIFRRLGNEAFAAARRAEIVGAAGVVRAMLRGASGSTSIPQTGSLTRWAAIGAAPT